LFPFIIIIMKTLLTQILFLGYWIVVPHQILVAGFPDGAGGCEGGVAAAGGAHLDSSKSILSASLFEGGIAVFIGDTELEPSRTDTFPIGQDLPIQVVALPVSGDPVPFKGVLIRVEPPDGVDAFNAIMAAENTQQAGVCEAPVGGITHLNRDDKTLASGTIRFDEEVVGVALDVTVVFLNEATASAYAYTRFAANFRAVTPVPAPVLAPVPAPVPVPVAGPTNPPTLGGTPQPTPFNTTMAPSLVSTSTPNPTITNGPSVTVATDNPTTPLSTPEPSSGMIATDAPTPYGTYYPPPTGKGKGKGGHLRPPHYPGGKGKGKHSKKSKGSKGKGGKSTKSSKSSGSSDEYYHHHNPRPYGYGYFLNNFFGGNDDDYDGGMARGQRNQLRLQLTGRYAYNRNSQERWDGD
jgi:hypothetical protein